MVIVYPLFPWLILLILYDIHSKLNRKDRGTRENPQNSCLNARKRPAAGVNTGDGAE